MEEQPMETQSAPVQPTPDLVYEPPAPETRRHTGGIIWAAVLISAGVVFLLNNLGVLSWGVWVDILRFWPVLLIAAGVSIVFGRRSFVGAALAATLVVGAIGAAIFLFPAHYGYTFGYSAVTENVGAGFATEQISQPLGTATGAEYDIRAGVADLRINGEAAKDKLIDGSVSYGPGMRVTHDYSTSGGTARYQVNSEAGSHVWFPSEWWSQGSNAWVWQLGLNGTVPASLSLETGVGRANVDLSKTQVTNLEVSTGIGETTLVLPSHGKVEAQIQRGVGRVVVQVPAGVAVRMHLDEGLGGVRVTGNFTNHGNNEYSSPGYDSATNKVDLQVNGGLGDFTLEQLTNSDGSGW